MSDPFTKFGRPKTVDGIHLLKAGVELPYIDAAESVTRGDWSTREANFFKLFGVYLLEIRRNKADLERIREIRNSFAHGFGRDLEIPEPATFDKGTTAKLSEPKLLEYFGLLTRIAKEIDRFLMEHHVGHFELVYSYHLSSKAAHQAGGVNQLSAKDFKKMIYDYHGHTSSERYCQSLMDFYNAV